jgi:hypothetical protein
MRKTACRILSALLKSFLSKSGGREATDDPFSRSAVLLLVKEFIKYDMAEVEEAEK